MLIDPQGLFYGERISACSDEAQLHFPRLMAASNGFARIDMSVSKLHSTVYAGFKVKPTREMLRAWFREYHANFLLFVYQAQSGEVWGQWAVSKGKLPRWKTSEDNRSPAPPESEYQDFLATYIEQKRARYVKSSDSLLTSEDFGRLPKTSEDFGRLRRISEDFGRLPHGEVVGEVVGVGEVFAQTSSSPVLSLTSQPAKGIHAQIRQLFGECPWDGGEGKALDGLLRAVPSLTVERARVCLENRRQSDVNLAERPRRWIQNLMDYELGPLDAYGKPKALSLRPKTGTTIVRAPDIAQTASVLRREDEERAAIIEEWRGARSDLPEVYAAQAPQWVKDVLEHNELEARVA